MSDYSIDPGSTIERLISERDAALAELMKDQLPAHCWCLQALAQLIC